MIEEGSLQEFIHGCKYELMEDFMTASLSCIPDALIRWETTAWFTVPPSVKKGWYMEQMGLHWTISKAVVIIAKKISAFIHSLHGGSWKNITIIKTGNFTQVCIICLQTFSVGYVTPVKQSMRINKELAMENEVKMANYWVWSI